MSYDVDLQGRTLHVSLSPAAQNALAARSAPLAVEMELYFSCLIRKAVRFTEPAPGEPARHGLVLRFRPVMSQGCAVDPGGAPPPLVDMPITGGNARFVPRWLTLDFRDAQWRGEFGYAPPA